jgi:hypothetical protein
MKIASMFPNGSMRPLRGRITAWGTDNIEARGCLCEFS